MSQLLTQDGATAATSKNAIRWSLPESLRHVLLDDTDLRLNTWLEEGQATIIKKGPHRIVYRVQLGSLCFFVKHNLTHDWRAWLRNWVRPNKARIEYDCAIALSERGIQTVIPLGIGEPVSRLGNGESFLLTYALEQTATLQQYLLDRLQGTSGVEHARIRQKLATRLGDWIARLHAAGVRHNDFHAGNILVREKEGDIELFLIDLNAVKLTGPLSWEQSRANLVMLNRWFSLRSSRSDRFRFWRAYFARWQKQETANRGQTAKIIAQDVERRTLLSNLDFWRSRDERCLEKNRYYRKLKVKRVTGHVVSELDVNELRALMTDPDAPFLREGARIIKDSRSSTVCEMDLTIHGIRQPVIYKRFRVTRWHDPFRSLLRPSEAIRSWVNGQGLCERALPTPRPLAVFHKSHLGLQTDGYLITEKVENASTLVQAVKESESVPGPEGKAARRALIVETARILRIFHRYCLGHRDLKASNLLVSSEPRKLTHPGGDSVVGLVPHLPSRVWIIDLVGMTRHKHRLPRRHKVQNLARLNVSFLSTSTLSRTDRLRFLREYMQWGIHGKDGWKRIWREIEQASQRKIERNQRHGRIVA